MEIMTTHHLKKTWKWLRACLIIGIIFFIFIIIGIFGLYLYGVTAGPPPLAVPQTSIFYGDDGSVIGESHSGENRYWVTLDDMSPSVIKATLSIEDRKFFDHHGFDIKRIFGAAIADIKAMAMVQGASTITQQYARNLFLDHDKTWKRKFYEALYTIRLETNYSKEEILEGYLNTIYYGHGSYGIEAAANYYFDKHAKDLTLAEASMLAGIPKAPSYYSPLKDEERAERRQAVVLQTMIENEYIQEQDAITARDAQLQLVTNHDLEREDIAPYFLDEVKKQLLEKVKLEERVIEMGGLRIHTTLNPNIQKITEERIKETINPDSDIQTAVVSMDPDTGEVKALVGGRNYEKSPFNRVTQAERMPGSTFKPFLYYTAIANGFTPATVMRSEPTNFRYDDGREVYSPSNYNSYYANDFITLAQAIALSDNIYAVKTNMFVGPEKLVETAKKVGITTDLDPNPSLALGTSTVRVMDMVKGYGVIANGGKDIEPTFIKKVVNHEGEVIYESQQEKEQILDPKTAFVTSHVMTGMFDSALNDYTSVTGTTIANKLSRPYAGKSGTTSTDSWMIGYTPQLVTGVWVGYDRDKTMDIVAERRYAKKIWSSVMEDAHQGVPVEGFRPPEGVVSAHINPDNGKLATESCPVKRLTYFVEGTAPTVYCTEHIGNDEVKPKPEEKEPKEDKGWFNKMLDWFS